MFSTVCVTPCRSCTRNSARDTLMHTFSASPGPFHSMDWRPGLWSGRVKDANACPTYWLRWFQAVGTPRGGTCRFLGVPLQSLVTAGIGVSSHGIDCTHSASRDISNRRMFYVITFFCDSSTQGTGGREFLDPSQVYSRANFRDCFVNWFKMNWFTISRSIDRLIHDASAY